MKTRCWEGREGMLEELVGRYVVVMVRLAGSAFVNLNLQVWRGVAAVQRSM